MISLADAGVLIALAAALAAVVLGRNLTRSIAATGIAMLALALGLLGAGHGFAGLCVLVVASLQLLLIQLFGWMLVDVDQDHVPPTDGATRFARSLAFVLLGGGLGLLYSAIGPLRVATVQPSASVQAIGMKLFGDWNEIVWMAGLCLAATTLAALMLMRDDRPTQ